jgi:uncharacterized protein YkwD
MPKFRHALSVIALATPLGACLWGGPAREAAAPATFGGGQTFYQRLDSSEAKVNVSEAAAIISAYRANNGLGKVVISPRLNAIAAAQANAMARADKMSHDVGGPFARRLAQGGYDMLAAAENIGAGYRTLAEAFSGWRGSPPHNANLLNREVTEIGIANAYAPGGKYKVYWALVLAKPR